MIVTVCAAKQQVQMTDNLFHLRILHVFFPVYYAGEDKQDFLCNKCVFDPVMCKNTVTHCFN